MARRLVLLGGNLPWLVVLSWLASVACTAGTLAATVWWAARLPGLRRPGLVAWMALCLLCTSATYAVWTCAGELETSHASGFNHLWAAG